MIDIIIISAVIIYVTGALFTWVFLESVKRALLWFILFPYWFYIILKEKLTEVEYHNSQMLKNHDGLEG